MLGGNKRLSKIIQQCNITPNPTANYIDVHHSWSDSNNADTQQNMIEQIRNLQQNMTKSNYVTEYQNDLIPVYDVSSIDNIHDTALHSVIYNEFYNGCGALIVRNGYNTNLMNEYNLWCENFLDIAKNDANSRHPKQKGKILINDIILRISRDNPDLLMNLLNNKYFTLFADILLGFSKFGSCTAHWITPGGDRQLSHVDYPIHIGSGKFWENNVNKLKKLCTNYQLNKILPFYSIQVLIASDAMNVDNGSTEIIPCTHQLDNVDVLIHNKQVYNMLEPYFMNVSLNQGDFLIFNRRIIHRGGQNKSNKRRNSLIMQCIWLWGVGQEIIEFGKVLNHLNKSYVFNQLNDKQKEDFLLRLKAPYPANIKKAT